jgi:SEC-C motif-containing protein
MTTLSIERCRCGSGKNYQDCCETIINDFSQAKTVEQLMRSRYTAYTQNNLAYIKQTMTGNALKDYEQRSKSGWEAPTKWLSLVVHDSKTLNKRGHVDFSVTYMREGKKLTMREHSIFKKIDGRWYYVDRQT